MRYTEARAILSEAIEQLDEMTDAEIKAHEARMAEQERTAYKSPKMRYHLAKLRKLAKPAAKKQKGKLDEATRAEIKRAAAHKAKFEKIRAGNKKYLKSNLKNVKKAGHEDGLTKLGLDYGT